MSKGGNEQRGSRLLNLAIYVEKILRGNNINEESRGGKHCQKERPVKGCGRHGTYKERGSNSLAQFESAQFDSKGVTAWDNCF